MAQFEHACWMAHQGESDEEVPMLLGSGILATKTLQ